MTVNTDQAAMKKGGACRACKGTGKVVRAGKEIKCEFCRGRGIVGYQTK